MKKIAIVGAVTCASMLALSLAGCASGDTGSSSTSAASSAAQEQTQEAAKDFDGSSYTDTGAGEMYLSTAGGTSQDGNVPEIAASPDTVMQIGLNYVDGDGSVCTVYVDGMENTSFNAGTTQQSITIMGDAVAEGEHLVEVVAMNGDEPAIYKSAKYAVVTK